MDAESPEPPRTPCRVLFVCRYNCMRSPTAERLFAKRRDLDVRSAGTSSEALARVNANMLDWADLVFVMDDRVRSEIERQFEGHPAIDRLICLEIPDEFSFLQPELIDLLETRVPPHLPRAIGRSGSQQEAGRNER